MGSQRPLVVIREMRSEDARAFLDVHHAAVRGIAAKDYPLVVIEAWAPIPVTEDAIERVRVNPDKEYRLIAEIEGRVVGIGAAVFEIGELRACYVTPDAGRKGVGSALVKEIERAAREQGVPRLELDSSVTAESFYRTAGYEVIERGEHVLRNGQRMACVKMRKELGEITGCAFATRAHRLSPATIGTYNMTTEVEIRRATAGDAEAVYEIVLRALRETNARDYPTSVIDRLVLTLPEGVASKLEEWHAYVAVVVGRIVGTGSLNGKTVGAVFVHPDYQGRGIGTKLMDAVENAANIQSVNTLSVQSSITAQPFYARRGFKFVHEGFYGEERTIVMSKDISSPSE